MQRLRRAAILAELADRLKARGSWCGETHIQKAAYVLQEGLGVPLDVEFILYRRGPFSFDLRDELTAMRADGLLKVRPRPAPYGPSLDATTQSQSLRERLRNTIKRFQEQVLFVAERMGDKTASELERLSTAYYVIHSDMPGADTIQQAARIAELKPHVGEEQAVEALHAVARMREEAEEKELVFSL